MKYVKKTAFIVLIDLIISLICLFRGAGIQGYEFVFILPAAHIFCVLLPNFRYLAKRFLGIKVLYLTIIVRYCILPFCLICSGEVYSDKTTLNAAYLRIACFLMMVELIVVSIVVNFWGSRMLLRNRAEQTFSISLGKERSHLLDYIIILIASVFLILHPDLTNNFSFILYDVNSRTVSYFRGLDIRLIQIAIILFFCLFTLKCKNKHDSTGKRFFYILALIVGVGCMLIFKGENRAALLINVVSVTYVLLVAFPNQKKRTLQVTLILGMCSLVILSLYRILAVTSWRPEGGTLDLSFIGLAKMIQAYLAGPNNIAIGLEAIKKFPASFETFYSDFLIWSGYLGNFLSETFGLTYKGTNYLFNSYLYGNALISSGDQIAPMCVQSIWYFGYLGSMLFSAFTAFLIVFFDYRLSAANSLGKIYINTMMAMVTGLMMGYNVTIISMYFMDKYLLPWTVISISTYWTLNIRIRLKS